jgi:excisionase family DNA binding protein
MENLTEGLTLETLPKAFTNLTNEVSEIKRLLLEKSNQQPTETDGWFDLNELCIYHPDKPSKPTVYGWVNAGTIPVHKGGKKLRFLKSEIDSWLKQGKRKTFAEIASEADTYLKRKGGNNG